MAQLSLRFSPSTKQQFSCYNPIKTSFFAVVIGTVIRTDILKNRPSSGVPCSKPPGGSKVDSAFHPSEVDEMSTRNFWELNGKK